MASTNYTVMLLAGGDSAERDVSLSSSRGIAKALREAVDGLKQKLGDVVVLLEAMKMELPIRADTDGTVASVSCKPGDLVQPGVPLVEIE